MRTTPPSAQAGSRADPKRLHEAVNVGSNPLPVFSGPRSQPVPPQNYTQLSRVWARPRWRFQAPFPASAGSHSHSHSCIYSSLFSFSEIGVRRDLLRFNSMESPVVTGNLHRASLLVSRCLGRFFGLVSVVVPTLHSLSYVRRSEWWRLQISCKY